MTQDHAEIAALFRASLPTEAETLAFRIDPLDRLGIPVVQANLLTPDRPTVIGHGYGFTEAEAATGALGELCEEVHLGTWLKRQAPVEASHAALLARVGPSGVADPLTLCLPAGSDYDPEATRRWLPARRYPSDETVLVPIEWVAIAPYQLGGHAGLITPITNGLGAGLDLDHAVAHGVMELLQRDGNVLTYRAFDQGAVVTFDTPLDPDCDSLCRTLRDAGIDVTVKLAGTGFRHRQPVRGRRRSRPGDAADPDHRLRRGGASEPDAGPAQGAAGVRRLALAQGGDARAGRAVARPAAAGLVRAADGGGGSPRRGAARARHHGRLGGAGRGRAAPPPGRHRVPAPDRGRVLVAAGRGGGSGAEPGPARLAVAAAP